jgi:hypothetical protein
MTDPVKLQAYQRLRMTAFMSPSDNRLYAAVVPELGSNNH